MCFILDPILNWLINNPWFSQKPQGYLLLLMTLSVATSIGLPRQLAAFSAGMLCGAVYGFFIALTATVFGCTLTAITARYLLANWLKRNFQQKAQVVHQFLASDTFIKALVIRILPLGSNFLTNIIAGATRIKLRPYVLGSAIGFIPQMVIFSLIGSGITIAKEQQQELTLSLLIIALILIAMLWLKPKIKKRLSSQ
ncbi:TVP38/TMEM64 family protein [Colwellia sp. MEBiC06753]